MTIDKKHILVLPRWYPNKTDVQLGVFIQRQIELMKDDFNFTVVFAQGIPKAENKYTIIEQVKGNCHEVIIYFNQSTGIFRKLTNAIRFRKALLKGLEKIKWQIDITHVHVPYRTAFPAVKLKKSKAIPFLITEHWSGHLNGEYKRKNALDKYTYKKVLKRADKISTVSETLRVRFKENTGFDSVCIPNYIEKSNLIDQEEKETIEVLSVSDLYDANKNISGLILAFGEALKTQPNLRLTIIGGGPDEQVLRDLVKTLGFESDRVNFKGRLDHDNVLAAMVQCDYYICNSRFETFGMTVAEALLHGKPVICTRCGGPEDFLLESNSISISTQAISNSPSQELVNAILDMTQTYQSYDSKELSSQIAEKFGSKSVREKWLSFYTI